MTTTRILLAIALLAALAACKIGGDETRTGAGAACVAVSAACAQNSDCCSYGCLSGVCVANPAEGGACRTTNDCASPRLCKSAACTTPTAGMCRDNADVCSLWSQCCSGNCEGGACTQNRPPVANVGPANVTDVPYTKLYTLTNASTDPDGDPLSFGWSFVSVPAGSAAMLSSTIATNPTFTPDRAGPYVVRLVVTDGPSGAPNRYTVETQVTIHAVNREPQPTATAQASTCAVVGGELACSRNNPVRISATAVDVDGDTLECGWQVDVPAGAPDPLPVTVFEPCGNPSSASVDYTPQGEGTYVVSYVVRDHDRTTGEIVHSVAAAATFVAKNDPPLPVLSRSIYYGNLGPPGGTTPAVGLDASGSTDPNGDHLGLPGLSFFWEMVSASTGDLPTLENPTAATPSFVPLAAADYVLRVTVSDPAQFGRPAASTPFEVTVIVGRYVQPLGHTVADAARPSGVDKIVLAGNDPSDTTKGMVFVYDMATRTETASFRLVDPGDGSSALPRLVEVTPDGTTAVVVDQLASIWIVNLGTGTMRRVSQPFAIGDVVVPVNRTAFLFRSGGSDYLRELDLTNGTISQPAGAGYSAFGAAGLSGTTSLLYRVDTYFDDWYRYTVNNSGGLSQTAYVWGAPSCGGYPAQPATAIWGTLTGSYVVSSCGKVYSGTSLVELPTTLASPSWVDSTTAGTILVSSGTTLTRYGATLEPVVGGTDTIPRWSQNGYGLTATASKAFFDAAGTKRFAVVHDTATPVRHGIVTFP